MSKRNKHRNKNGRHPLPLPSFGVPTLHESLPALINHGPTTTPAPACESPSGPSGSVQEPPGAAQHPQRSDDLAGIGTTIRQAQEQIEELSVQPLVKAAPSVELPLPETLKQDEIIEYCREAYRAKHAYEHALQGLSQASSVNVRDAHAKLQEAQTDRARLSEERATIEMERREADGAMAAVRQREQKVSEREAAVEQREIEVAAGLISQRQAHIQSLDQLIESTKADLARLTEELASVRSRIQHEEQEHRGRLETISRAEHEKYRQELDREHSEAQQQLREDRVALEAEAKEVRTLQASVAKREKDLAVREELYQEDVKSLQGRVDRLVAAEREKLSLQLGTLKDERDQAREDRDALRAQLNKRDAMDQKFEGRSPEQVLAEINRLKNQNAQLKKRLESAANPNDVEHLEQLQKEQVRWEEDKRQLRYQLNDLKKQLEDKGIAVAELETLRRVKESRQSLNEMLQTEIDRLRGELDSRVKKHHTKNPFPACAAIDDDSGHQTPPPQLHTAITTLKAFASDLRHRMANPKQGKALYYSERDVRAFLGGLAMSRLHILQGISGTGKTSLPIAVAEAMGAGSQLVEVQAGWREIQDLVGHFNSFENTFYESKFLKALYQAQCPAYKDRPFFVILDEMNLSRIEQYGADLLSLLEQPTSQKRWLTLLSSPKPVAPRLIENGERIALPENVWFIGTANHDETTLEFADKTYDRAAVLELPWTKDSFKVASSPPERAPVAVDALRRAFAAANRTYGQKSIDIWSELSRRIAPVFSERFGVGWGNRLDRQVADFVPAVVAAGGSYAEAFDQLVCTKLLRKVRHRHDTSESDLRRLRDELLPAWKVCDDGLPSRCQDVLSAEIKRVSSDGELTGG